MKTQVEKVVPIIKPKESLLVSKTKMFLKEGNTSPSSLALSITVENKNKSGNAISAATHFISDLSPNYFSSITKLGNLRLARVKEWSKKWRHNDSLWRRSRVSLTWWSLNSVPCPTLENSTAERKPYLEIGSLLCIKTWIHSPPTWPLCLCVFFLFSCL